MGFYFFCDTLSSDRIQKKQFGEAQRPSKTAAGESGIKLDLPRPVGQAPEQFERLNVKTNTVFSGFRSMLLLCTHGLKRRCSFIVLTFFLCYSSTPFPQVLFIGDWVAEGGSVCRPHTQPRLAACPQSGGRLKSPRSRRSDNLKIEQKQHWRTDLSRQTQATGT